VGFTIEMREICIENTNFGVQDELSLGFLSKIKTGINPFKQLTKRVFEDNRKALPRAHTLLDKKMSPDFYIGTHETNTSCLRFIY
jgi:hypothetical protein